VRVFYGHDQLPEPHETLQGGLAKLRRLAREFPNSPRHFNVLYLGSNTLPRDWRLLLRLARARGVPLVWNQDGVAYRAWHGPGWERVNAPMRAGLAAASYVLYQSEFCRRASDRFLGPARGPSEVLYNAVDTRQYVPAPRPARPLTLLLGGTQHQRYRFETAVRTMPLLDPSTRLVVTGRLAWSPGAPAEAKRLVRDLGVGERIELAGAYRERDAPELLRRGDILLHTKVMDPCPNIVIEAMACGLPVVYAASGGTPELVGEDAGHGVPSPEDWERDHPPNPAALAAAVRAVAERLDERAAAARDRAVARFDLEPWLARHRRAFAEVRE
jgi:glycosyltransferase involved in cell wall biosynthesis